MSYLGPQLTGAANAIDNLGWNVSGYTNCVHTVYSASGITYDVYSFTVAGPASITFTQSVANVDILTVGGGGGGGSVIGGGGGGGQITVNTYGSLNGTYVIRVGNGGIGGIYTGTYNGGISGEATTITGTNVSTTALGGGGGGGYNAVAYSTPQFGLIGTIFNSILADQSTYYLNTLGGAHGGGSSGANQSGIVNGTASYFAGGAGYGNNYAGGGGGPGGVGSAGTASGPGAGASGWVGTYTGTNVTYGGGGGGGQRNGGFAAAAGGGVGGAGGYGLTTATMQGSNGIRGGGGGGGAWNDSNSPTYCENGGRGGDGVVVIRVPRTNSNATSFLFSTPSGTSGYTYLDYYPTYALGTFQNPAANASAIRTALGAVNGDYWYIYGTTLRRLYTVFDYAPAGKGHVLVGKGRQGTDWWNISGQNSFYLTSSDIAVDSVATLSDSMIMYLASATTWAGIRLIVNRFSGTNDSLAITGLSTNAFSWAHFPYNGGSPATVNITHYSQNWKQGTLHYTGSNRTDWGDTYNFNGTLNDYRRNFTWTWSSHGGYQGWSAGSTITVGYIYNGENHAIQLVNIYVES